MDVSNRSEALLLRLLSASARRGEVIASNVANQNTPGYVRRTLRFEEALAAALRDGRTDPLAVEPEIREDRATPARPDGNNVDAELEANALRENRLLYEAYASILQGHYALLKGAITGGQA